MNMDSTKERNTSNKKSRPQVYGEFVKDILGQNFSIDNTDLITLEFLRFTDALFTSTFK